LLAKARTDNRDTSGAEQAHRQALDISPAAANAYGFWLQVEGRIVESFEVFMRSLIDNPKQGMAYYALLDQKVGPDEATMRLTQMEPLVNDPYLAEFERLYLFYALGKAYEHLKRYEPAMESFDRANEIAYRIHNEGHPSDEHRIREINDATMAAFDGSVRRPVGNLSQRPIFVVGMVRSGTTLVEQILSSHPDVGPAGELEFWQTEPLLHYPYDRLEQPVIKEIATRYLDELIKADALRPRVTDKMPLNYRYLGFINTVFPEAKIVHLRRHPVDTCLSIYSNYFGGGPFPYRKESIVFNYREYLRMMDHWRKVIPPSNLIEVDYEDLVSSPEPAIRRIIDGCGLPWDDACLRPDENRSAVNTPSRWQVRQPMYTTSSEKWRRYEPWLGAFRELL
jgi:tetratricopeptide (TPR) repeat protein